MEEEKSEAAAKNSAGRRESRRTSETPQGTWLGGTRKGSLWLCYAGPLAKRQKKVGSQVIGEGRSLFPGSGTVGEVRRRVSNRAKKRVHT